MKLIENIMKGIILYPASIFMLTIIPEANELKKETSKRGLFLE